MRQGIENIGNKVGDRVTQAWTKAGQSREEQDKLLDYVEGIIPVFAGSKAERQEIHEQFKKIFPNDDQETDLHFKIKKLNIYGRWVEKLSKLGLRPVYGALQFSISFYRALASSINN
jgi:hypothetical protein